MPTTNSNCYKPPFPPCETDVYSYANRASFPPAGTLDKLYIDIATGSTYYWDGSAFQTTSATPTADIYVNNGSFNATTSELTLNDTDAGTPDVVIDLSALEADAYNGTSIDSTTGQVVLGNDVGATDAQLTSDREIPMGGFDINYNGSAYDAQLNANGTFIVESDSGAFQTQMAGSIYSRNIAGGYASRLEANQLGFDRAAANYIHATSNNGYLSFITNDATGTQQTMTMDENGDILIGAGSITSKAPNSPTGKNAILYVNGTDEDTVIDSGLDDYSGMVLSRLDTNTPATPGLATIGIDNNGLVGVVQGASGSFTAGGQTVTVTNGIITSII